MWRFKPFTPKETTELEGRCIDIGDVKVQIRNIIAEGGFSCVYLAQDAVNASKQYALKHMKCSDVESLDLVKKELSVMKSLRGHPNVVTLYSHTFLDMGRTKEAFLVMELCEKSLVSVLESRGAGYFEENQILAIFRDVCNAVFAMHSQLPPIAHRDLKAENLLLGADGLWKLCDFGSTSTNHKRFVKAEEMGIEEDNIRKHTTPAYRAPEMWDLLRRDLINEKVDIWALGCLLFRICYFKSAFDGESKLQVLNGNYRIPDGPKYSSGIVDLIRDMLQSSPEDRPDITQIWFRVNQQLPTGLQRSLPDQPPEMRRGASETQEGISKLAAKAASAHRSPPSPPVSTETTKKLSPPDISRSGTKGGNVGSFWSTPHAQDSAAGEDKNGPKFDQETTTRYTLKQDRTRQYPNQRVAPGEPSSRPRDVHSKDPVSWSSQAGRTTAGSTSSYQDEAFNSFVADFDTSKLNTSASNSSSRKESLESEVERLKEQLKQANLEKSEITSKYEKLSAICRSQRQELQELKQALGARSPSPDTNAVKNQTDPGNQASNKSPNTDTAKNQTSPGNQASVIYQVNSTVQKNLDKDYTSPDAKPWQAFSDDPSPHKPLKSSVPQSVRSRNGQSKNQNAVASSGDGKWGFETDSFTAVPVPVSQTPGTGERSNTQRSWDSNRGQSKPAAQPAGWAGF